MNLFQPKFWPLTLMVLIAIYGIGATTFEALGYSYGDSMYDAELIAQKIVSEDRNVNDCLKIKSFLPTYPSIGSIRSFCVRKYAELAQDPSACALLMPSEYGMDCIGNIWGKIIDNSNCHWYKNNEVRCFTGKELVPHIYDCSEKNIANFPDECSHRLAFKKKDTNLCLDIQNSILRAICEVRISTWNEYPALRSTIYFNDDIK